MEHIGRYTVLKELKAGGMGSVTLCKSPDGSLVVLKRPHSLDADAAVRLRDEARIGARLLHPSIVDTLDLFEHDGNPVLVVAYVDGPSLESLRQVGALPVSAVARVGRQIAEGLAALHEATDEHDQPLHILHRDVTPGNIVVDKEGDAKLIDLGIARFSERQAERTQEGFLRGTMRYLAPELLQGETYSPATDLWALGMVLWEAALGRFAYRGETDREVLAGILRGEPMELEDDERVDPGLAAVIADLLSSSPLSRIESAKEAAERFAALEDPAEGRQVTAQAIAVALEKKQQLDEKRAASIRHKLAEPFVPAGHMVGDAAFFGDVETAAESERYAPPPVELSLDDAAGGEREEDPTVDLRPRTPAPVLSRGDDDSAPSPAAPAPISYAFGEPVSELLPSLDDETRPLTHVKLPRAALPSDEDGRFPPLSDDAEDTLSFSDPRVPQAALRSDEADLAERADGFDDGVSLPKTEALPPAAAAAPSATAGPTPELDDDDVQELQTLVRAPPPPPRSPLVPPPEELRRSLARIGLVRKTRAQIEAEQRGKSGSKPSIDELPPARPRRPSAADEGDESDDTRLDLRPPREERPASAAGLSPFTPPPVADDGTLHESVQATVAALAALDLPEEVSDDVKATMAALATLEAPAAAVAEDAAEPAEAEGVSELGELAEAPEPTQVDGPLMDSEHGARLVELPAPQGPVLTTPTFAAFAEAPPEPAAPQKAPPRERGAGEVMNLADVAAFLDDE